MANVYATKTGNWSDVTVWNTGALPTAADDVYSNNFTVTIDISPTVLSISNLGVTGITPGGSFSLSNGITLTANINGGKTTCLSFTTTTATVIGNVIGGYDAVGSSSSNFGINHNSAGTLNVIGNVTGGPVGSGGGSLNHGIACNSSGILNVTGNVIAGNRGNNHGILNNSAGTVNISGNVSGSTITNANAIFNNSSGVVNIIGSVTGGAASAILNQSIGTITITGSVTGSGVSAIVNSSTGAITITGDVNGGPGGSGFTNSSSGTVTHIGSAFASASAPAIGVGSASQVTILTGPLVSTSGTGVLAAASGVNPCQALRWFVKDTALSTFTYIMRGATASGSPSERPERVLALPEGYAAGYPLPSDVRAPVTYGPAALYTGTCAVPDPSSVVAGVAVDDTVGTAFINPADVWNVQFSTVNGSGTIGERLGKSATIDSTGAQIIALGA